MDWTRTVTQMPEDKAQNNTRGATRLLRVLFVCTVNRLRSPTAETVFGDWPGVEVLSAGTDAEATNPLTKELVANVDVIFAMEAFHRERIRKKFNIRPPDNRIITLHIPDEYERDDPILKNLLERRAGPSIRQFLQMNTLLQESKTAK